MVTLSEMYHFHVPTPCPVCLKPAGDHTPEEFGDCLDIMKERRLSRDARLVLGRLK